MSMDIAGRVDLCGLSAEQARTEISRFHSSGRLAERQLVQFVYVDVSNASKFPGAEHIMSTVQVAK